MLVGVPVPDNVTLVETDRDTVLVPVVVAVTLGVAFPVLLTLAVGEPE